MKILKLILIILIYLSGINLAQAKNIIDLKSFSVKTDTIVHHKPTKRKNIYPTPPPAYAYSKKYESYNDCMFVKRYSIKQRLKEYPFSKAVKILAVSYPYDLNQNVDIDTDKKSKPKSGPVLFSDSVFISDLHIRNGILNYSSLKETEQLTAIQINKLTNLLYNTTYKRKNPIANMGYSCFNPRNALVFFDKDGKVFDYLQVCFECKGMRSLSYRIWFKRGCNQQLDYLKK